MAIAKAERLMNLALCLLGTRRPLSKRELRGSIEAYLEAGSDDSFNRMFERDKDDLRELGLVIETVEGLATVRSALEGSMSAEIATRRSDEELAQLRTAFAHMEETIDDDLAYSRRTRLPQPRDDPVGQSARREHHQHPVPARPGQQSVRRCARRASFDQTLVEHGRVLEAIEAGDSPAAEAAMRTHIIDAWMRRRPPNAKHGYAQQFSPGATPRRTAASSARPESGVERQLARRGARPPLLGRGIPRHARLVRLVVVADVLVVAEDHVAAHEDREVADAALGDRGLDLGPDVAMQVEVLLALLGHEARGHAESLDRHSSL